jgi:hypothetical protein
MYTQTSPTTVTLQFTKTFTQASQTAHSDHSTNNTKLETNL